VPHKGGFYLPAGTLNPQERDSSGRGPSSDLTTQWFNWSGNQRRSNQGSTETCSLVADSPLLLKNIGEYKTISCDNLTHPDRNRSTKDRSGIDEGMKFSVLSARIDARRQIVEKSLIEVAACKSWREALFV